MGGGGLITQIYKIWMLNPNPFLKGKKVYAKEMGEKLTKGYEPLNEVIINE